MSLRCLFPKGAMRFALVVAIALGGGASPLLGEEMPGSGDAPSAAPSALGLQAYKENYFIYTRDYADHSRHAVQSQRQWVEARFQFSLKSHILHTRYFPLYFGYTQKSFWQVFDEDGSRPFRENNYNPELFLMLFQNTRHPMQVGLWEHESNGQVISHSRSWDRYYLWPTYQFSPDVSMGFKYWWRYREDPKTSPEDPLGDENPTILDYLGRFELSFNLAWQGSGLAGKIRKGRADPDGTYQLDYRFPAKWLFGWAQPVVTFSPKTHALFTYFYGYGESLIDYDESVKKAGLGVALDF